MPEEHSDATDLVRRFEARTARVVVVGADHTSLDIAAAFAAKGFDAKALQIAFPERRRVPREDEPGLADARRAQAHLRTHDETVLDLADAVILCPPVALTKTRTPDASPLLDACEQLARRPRRTRLVAIESTASVGTARGLLAPVFEKRGATIGRDLFLAVVPTRVPPPNSDWRLANTPRVIGGLTPSCLGAARALYGAIVDAVVPVSSAEAAEMVKAVETEFRAVNVALVNELAKAFHSLGLSTREVLDAAATKPFGFMAFDPGPGLADTTSGSATAELTWTRRALRPDAALSAAADEVNLSMPRWIVARAAALLNDDARAVSGAAILLSGVTYRRDASAIQDSPAIEILAEFLRLGAEASYLDPFVRQIVVGDTTLTTEAGDLGGKRFDLTVILTDHTAIDLARVVASSRVVFDLRNATSRLSIPAGVRVVHL